MTKQRRSACLVASLSLALSTATAGARHATLEAEKPVVSGSIVTAKLVLASTKSPEWAHVERATSLNDGGPRWGLDSLTLSATPEPGAAGLAILALGSAAAAMRVSRRRDSD